MQSAKCKIKGRFAPIMSVLNLCCLFVRCRQATDIQLFIFVAARHLNLLQTHSAILHFALCILHLFQPFVSVHNDCDGAVVEKLNLHIGAENTFFDISDAVFKKLITKSLVESVSLFGRC